MQELARTVLGRMQVVQADVAKVAKDVESAFSAAAARNEQIREADRASIYALLKEAHDLNADQHRETAVTVTAAVGGMTEQVEEALKKEAAAGRAGQLEAQGEAEGGQMADLTSLVSQTLATVQALAGENATLKEQQRTTDSRLRTLQEAVAGTQSRQAEEAAGQYATLRELLEKAQLAAPNAASSEREHLKGAQAEAEALKRRLHQQEQLTYDAKKECSRLTGRLQDLEMAVAVGAGHQQLSQQQQQQQQRLGGRGSPDVVADEGRGGGADAAVTTPSLGAFVQSTEGSLTQSSSSLSEMYGIPTAHTQPRSPHVRTSSAISIDAGRCLPVGSSASPPAWDSVPVGAAPTTQGDRVRFSRTTLNPAAAFVSSTSGSGETSGGTGRERGVGGVLSPAPAMELHELAEQPARPSHFRHLASRGGAVKGEARAIAMDAEAPLSTRPALGLHQSGGAARPVNRAPSPSLASSAAGVPLGAAPTAQMDPHWDQSHQRGSSIKGVGLRHTSPYMTTARNMGTYGLR